MFKFFFIESLQILVDPGRKKYKHGPVVISKLYYLIIVEFWDESFNREYDINIITYKLNYQLKLVYI